MGGTSCGWSFPISGVASEAKAIWGVGLSTGIDIIPRYGGTVSMVWVRMVGWIGNL